MSLPDPFELELSSDPRCLCDMRECMSAWAAGRGWNDAEIDGLVIAVDEALANVIRHGYDQTPDCPIQISVQSICEPGRGEGVEITIRDYGRQVDPTRICGRDLDQPQPGGLGVHLIRNLMDSVEYSRAAGGGMRLVMRKFHQRSSHRVVAE